MDRLKENWRLLIIAGLTLFGVIFVASLAGTIKGYATPTETTSETTVASYSHNGQFTVKAFRRPGSHENTSLFLPIVESLDILFAYSFEPDQALEAGIEREVAVKAILEDRGGTWKKEVSLIAEMRETSRFELSFPLRTAELLELAGSIEQELVEGKATRFPWVWLTLEAKVRSQNQEVFVTTLKGKLSPTTLEWQDGFENRERGSLNGVNYWQVASFGYQAKLKPNLLFGPITLSRETNTEKPSVITTDSLPAAKMVEAIDVSFSFQFTADARINSLKEEGKLTVVLKSPGRWEKTLPHALAKNGDNLTLTLSLDLDNLREMAGKIDGEMGFEPTKELQVVFAANVESDAALGLETISEVFEQQFTVVIGEKIGWDKDSTVTKKGEIKKEVIEFNQLAWQLRRYPWIGLGTSFLVLSALGFIYHRKRPPPAWLQEQAKQRKKYKDLLSKVEDCPPVREGETMINLTSLDELAKTANNLVKPILYREEPTRVAYWILDVSATYQFVAEEEKQA